MTIRVATRSAGKVGSTVGSLRRAGQGDRAADRSAAARTWRAGGSIGGGSTAVVYDIRPVGEQRNADRREERGISRSSNSAPEAVHGRDSSTGSRCARSTRSYRCGTSRRWPARPVPRSSRNGPGMSPSTTVSTLATTRPPHSSRPCASGRLLGARLAHEHVDDDAEVVERRRGRVQDRDDREDAERGPAGIARLDGGEDDVRLGEEAGRRRDARQRQQEQGHQDRQPRLPPAEPGERVEARRDARPGAGSPRRPRTRRGS